MVVESDSCKSKILIMDDDSVIDTISKILRLLGYDVECAKDGAEAIHIYKNAYNSTQPVDVVLMDLFIPGGMGGKDTIKVLLKSYPEIKAIIISGYINDPIMMHYDKFGFKRAIIKPFTIMEINYALQVVINQ